MQLRMGRTCAPALTHATTPLTHATTGIDRPLTWRGEHFRNMSYSKSRANEGIYNEGILRRHVPHPARIPLT